MPDSKQTHESNSTKERQFVRRAVIPIIDRRFQFRVTFLLVTMITLTHLAFGGYVYVHASSWAERISDLVPDLLSDANWFTGALLNSMLLTIVTTFITIVLLSLYFSARISGPLFNMTRIFAAVARGDFSKRIRLRRADELEEFARMANQLFELLEKRDEKLKAFLGQLKQELNNGGKVQMASLERLERDLTELQDQYTEEIEAPPESKLPS